MILPPVEANAMAGFFPSTVKTLRIIFYIFLSLLGLKALSDQAGNHKLQSTF